MLGQPGRLLSVAATVTQTAGARARAVDAWNIADDVETAFYWGMGTDGMTPSPRDYLSVSIALS